MAGSQDDIPPPPPSQTPTQQTPHTVSTIKLPILKMFNKGSASQDCRRILARERKARTTLLMALPEDHLAKFHKITDVKEMWEAIKSRFLWKWMKLLSQLEIHGAGISTEDANQKFLRVFESNVKGSTVSSSSTQNVTFVSENTSSTNDSAKSKVESDSRRERCSDPLGTKDKEDRRSLAQTHCRTSDIEDSPVNDRYAEGMHAVPPPMTGIYIPSGLKETHESMPEPVVNEPKVVSQPKVWSDAPIIEEYESD
ncbi:hypothetical protein Tco_0385878 [Tanacetum coccineum]